MPAKKKAPARAKPKPRRPRADHAAGDPLEESWRKAWGSLTDPERAYLEDMYDRSTFAREARALGRAEEAAFRSWIEGIWLTEVVVRSAGRARVRRKDAPYALDVQWAIHDDLGVVPKSLSVVALDERVFESIEPIPQHEHMVALALHLSVMRPREFMRMPRARPARGRPPTLAYYKALIEFHDTLKAEGHKAPAQEVARRLGFDSVGTAKSQLSRGRKYVAEAERRQTEGDER